jgi:hypothetical protein
VEQSCFRASTPMAEAGGYRRRPTGSEAVFRRRIRLASLIAVSLSSLGLWVTILWVLASLISVVLG